MPDGLLSRETEVKGWRDGSVGKAVAKLDDLSSNPRTHMVGDNGCPQLPFEINTHPHTAHMCAHIQAINKNFKKGRLKQINAFRRLKD